MGDVVAAGGTALMITADGNIEQVADGVEVLDLVCAERSFGVHALLSRSPLRLLRRVRGGESSGASWAWRRWSTCKPYRAMRPWLLWRVLRRELGEDALTGIDHVVMVGQESWPIAWHLSKRNPTMTVAWDVPDEVFERFGRHPVVRESAPEPAPDAAPEMAAEAAPELAAEAAPDAAPEGGELAAEGAGVAAD